MRYKIGLRHTAFHTDYTITHTVCLFQNDCFINICFQVIEQKNLHSLNSESNTEHDGDVEDMSDGERTSSDHGLLFYPSVAPGTPT